MKRNVWVAVLGGILVASIGCGGGDENLKQDVSRLQAAVSSLESKVDSSSRDLADKIKDERVDRIEQIGKVSGIGAEMLKTYQQMKNQMEDLQKLKAAIEKTVAGIDAKVSRANKDLLAVLENEAKLHEDRLSVMKETIEDLKKD